ncbi:hypothetical protein N9509_06010 [Amylibacter sp.]|nr:hypothetical protein [Amylibacter sp.]
MKLSHIVVFVSLVFVAYIGGFVTGIKKIFPYTLAHQMYRSFLPLEHGDVLGFNTCEIEEVFELPSIFSVLIGHAAGGTTKNNGFIAPKIERFLQKNRILLG